MEKKSRYSKISRFLLLSIYILFIGILGAILAEKTIIPRLAKMQWFSKWDLSGDSIEYTTIYNTTERIVDTGDVISIANFEENRQVAIQAVQDPKNPTEGFVITDDGLAVIFAPSLESDTKFIENYQGEIREFHVVKSEDNFKIVKCLDGCFNISVLPFCEECKNGEEISVISADAVLSVSVKSIEDDKILISGFPDKTMNGSMALNAKGEIVGMYVAEENYSFIIPTKILWKSYNK